MFALLALTLAASNPYLDEAKKLSSQLKFAEAIEQLKVARQVPGQTDAEQVDALDLLARCLVAEGRRGEAQQAFEELLVLSPQFAPDRSLSPKILEAFDAAKSKLFPPDYFKLEPQPAAPGRARLRIVDPWRRASAFEVSIRKDTEPAWSVTALTAEADALTLELTGEPLHTLEWYVSALDATGTVVGRYGTAQEPQRHTVPAVSPGAVLVVREETPRAERWPAWFAIGLGVAAAAVGSVFQYNSITTAKQLDDRTRPPGMWADQSRDAWARASFDATVATALFVIGGVAAAVGVLVFAW